MTRSGNTELMSVVLMSHLAHSNDTTSSVPVACGVAAWT